MAHTNEPISTHRPTDLDDAIGDVNYELEMLDYAVARYAAVKRVPSAGRKSQLEEWAWMEEVAIHARALFSFFLRTMPEPQEDTDDVRVRHFIEDWVVADSKIKSRANACMSKANKWVAHITFERAKYRAKHGKNPDWSPFEIQGDLHTLWREFTGRVARPELWLDPDPTDIPFAEHRGAPVSDSSTPTVGVTMPISSVHRTDETS
jgi:hypothetical protein